MAAFRSASFCLIVCFLICSSEAQEKITAKHGENATLPCRDPNITNIKNIRAVEWIRLGWKTEYVLVYRDGRLDPVNQHPSYQNRVDLQDKDMKDGDASLILKNVMKNDTGIYKCWVFQGGTNRRKRSDPEPISIINLEVHSSGDKDGNTGDGGNKTGIIAGSVVGVILLLAVASVGSLICRRHKRQNKHVSVPPDEQEVQQIL